MKTFLKPFVALSAVAFLASQAMASLPNQPFVVPPTGDLGAYAVQDQAVGPTDIFLAKAYDNFTLSQDYVIDGFCWAGLYAEPLPVDPSDTDFIIQIWNVDQTNGLADVWGGPVLEFHLEGGSTAGTGGSDLVVTRLAHDNNLTTPGGEAFHYDGTVTPTSLAAGDYWISILADQRFDNKVAVDPEWMWHLGSGPGDGFTTFDRTLDPPGTNQQGTLTQGAGKDLAFEIKAVPEPSTMLMAIAGLAPLGLLRRKRQ